MKKEKKIQMLKNPRRITFMYLYLNENLLQFLFGVSCAKEIKS
jgi:hypothetical protein